MLFWCWKLFLSSYHLTAFKQYFFKSLIGWMQSGAKEMYGYLFSIISTILSSTSIVTTTPILIHWYFSKTDASNLYINCSIILMSAVVVLGQAEVCKGCSEVYQAAGKLIAIYNLQCVLEIWRKFWVRFSIDNIVHRATPNDSINYPDIHV